MMAGARCIRLAAILSLEAIVSIGFVRGALAHGDVAIAGAEEEAVGSKTGQAGATEAPPKETAKAPEWQTWVKWGDLFLERFRVLELKLRGSQGGMAVVLRLQAAGLYSGPEKREELLRQSAAADPEQQGIWGELGVEQVRRSMLEEAAATLKTAQERQAKELWTLRLEAMMAASRGDWKAAEAKLLELGSRSPAMSREEIQSWPGNLAPRENVVGEIWRCVRENSAAACVDKIKFPASEIHDFREIQDSEEQLFAEERWEQLAELPEPRSEAPAAWFRRGVALAELKDCGRATPALERGLDVGAEAAAYWLERCYAAEAERSIARLGASGNSAAFHRVRGDFLVRAKGDMQGATEEYKKAMQLDPRDPVPAERLAQAYENIGDMPRAKQAAHEALALDPRRVVSLRLLASIAMNERDYANAVESLNKLVAMQPNVAWTRVQLGIAYAHTGQPQEALANLQPALAAGYPDERGALHAILARVLRKLGREQEAQSAAAESTRLSNLFQQHGSTPATPPVSPPEERR
ncbi:MAG TPA: tetratricopeptide repeat protein [Candidatus Acidoferrum sp.]|nr:tetratricopeptide repeat protein [Candidatus Acidoferrum sp.]